MTLHIGAKLGKLNDQLELVSPAREVCVTYEVVDMSPTYEDMCEATRQNDNEQGTHTVMFVKLRKVQ